MSDNKYDKLAFFLPNIFTAMNLACGFIAIVFSMQGQFYKACMIVLLGSVFDMVDGRVARLTGTQSSFGEQFDSLSDLISFGAAPSLIFYNKFLTHTGRLGIVIALLYLLCGALRLARFNANISKISSDYFQGLPIPGAAIGILSYILVSTAYPTVFNNVYVALPYMLIYGVLMISNVPFTSLKNSQKVKRHKRKLLFLIFITAAALFLYEELMLIIIISSYVLISFGRFLVNRKEFSDALDWDEQEH